MLVSVPTEKLDEFDWHAALLPTGRSGMHKITVASWRNHEGGPMQVVSGAMGKEKIHSEADILSTSLSVSLKRYD